MFHGIRWRKTGEFDFQPADRKRRMERVFIQTGQLVIGQARCHVNEQLVEVADIAVDEGILKDVPCLYFQFLDADYEEGEEGV